jgi:hypothetical protein
MKFFGLISKTADKMMMAKKNLLNDKSLKLPFAI